MNTQQILSSLTLATALLMTSTVFAHGMLEKSSPANGATLKTAPKTVDLEFEHSTRLTKFKLVSGDKEIPVALDTAAAAATTFAIPVPALVPGKYQVNWSALASDGHPMTGKLAFTISGN